MKARIAKHVCVAALLVMVGWFVHARIMNSRYPLTPEAAKHAIISLLKKESSQGSKIDILRAVTLQSVIDEAPVEYESGIVWVYSWRCDLQERRFESPWLTNSYGHFFQIGGSFSQNFDGTWSARDDSMSSGHGPPLQKQ